MDVVRVSLLLQATHPLKPRVLESLRGRQALTLFAQDALDQVFRLIRHVRPERTLQTELALLDLLHDLLVRVPLEGRLSAKQHVQNDSEGPHIALLAVCPFNDLRCQIVGSTKYSVHRMLVVDASGRSEVDKLDNGVVLVFEVDVLRLDITVNNIVLV